MRRVLAILVLFGFLGLPAVDAFAIKIKGPFEPPSLEKMTKPPVIKHKKPADPNAPKPLLGFLHK
jgi:hypothetical protein